MRKVTAFDKKAVIRHLFIPAGRETVGGHGQVLLSQYLLHGPRDMVFRKLLSCNIGKMRALAQELNHRRAFMEAEDANDIGDVVAVQTKGRGWNDVVLAPFHDLVRGQRGRLRPVNLVFRNTFEIMAGYVEY